MGILAPAIPVIASEAKQSSAEAPHWIASPCAPRKDDWRMTSGPIFV
jgi:hypothetical protein